MMLTKRIQRVLSISAISAIIVVGASACSAAPEEEPVRLTTAKLLVAPLGAHERSVMRAKAGDEFNLEKGGQVTKGGHVYAAAPKNVGTWAFAMLDQQGKATAFRIVDTSEAPATTGPKTSSLHILEEVGSSGSGSSCDQQACQAASSAALSAYGDWLGNVTDDLLGLAYGLKWYQKETEKTAACGGC